MAAASRVTETPCSKETGKTETCGLDKAYAPQMCSLFRWRFNLVNVESPLPTPTSFLVTCASQQSQGLLQQRSIGHGGRATRHACEAGTGSHVAAHAQAEFVALP